MNHHPKTVIAAIIIIIINALFWFIYALVMVFGGISSFAHAGTAKWVMAILALVTSVALVCTAYLIARRSRPAFIFGIVFLAMIAILSITDEFGILDLFSLLISLVPLGLMIKDRSWYLQPKKNQRG
jgi:hypothetical protein